MRKIILMMCGLILSVSISCKLDSPVSIEEQREIFEVQLAKDDELIRSYLAENEIEAIKDESGVYYVMTVEGEGDSPVVGDIVQVYYEGRFFDGEAFEARGSEDPDVVFQLSGLIYAWQVAIPLMKEGGKITIYAPSGFCYGTSGSDIIPSNTNLIFDIKLVKINP